MKATLIEREKECGCLCQASGHVDFIWINCKMDQSSFLKLENELVWISVMSILMNGIAPGLTCQGVLEFSSKDRNAI